MTLGTTVGKDEHQSTTYLMCGMQDRVKIVFIQKSSEETKKRRKVEILIFIII